MEENNKVQSDSDYKWRILCHQNLSQRTWRITARDKQLVEKYGQPNEPKTPGNTVKET
jgi:hypothetical protein